MKKSLFTIITFLLCLNVVKAFDIDMDKINVDNNDLLSKLNQSYKIDTDDFERKNIYNDNIKNITKELIEISFSDKSTDDKLKDFTKYMYISNNGFESINSSLFIKTYLDQITKQNISYENIKLIRTVEYDEGILSFTYLPNAKINDETQNIVIAFWYKKSDDDYKVHMPWITTEEEVNKRYNNILKEEQNNNIIGGTFKEMSLTENKQEVNEELLQQIYNNHKDEVCQINSIFTNEITSYGSCFFLRKGVVVTSWSLFQKFLSAGNNLYINDYEGNAYNAKGVISANVDYDIIVLKIDTEVGTKITIGDSNTLETDNKIFMINSLNNVNNTITYGTFISNQNGKLKNFFLINESNVGSAIYNVNGEVIAFQTGELINSELSYANSTNYIKELQEILVNKDFDNIEEISVDLFKSRYYFPLAEEKVSNNIPGKIWSKYKTIGNIEKTIPLELIKANYEDKVISLRYKNNIGNSIDTMYLLRNFIFELERSRFKLISESKNKMIFKNKNYEILIKNNMDYLCILIMEI